MAATKTNAVRMVEKAKLPYRTHEYPHGDGPVDGVTVAGLLGQDPAAVYKTLVTRGNGRDYYVFVIPVAEELDLKAAARAVGEKAVEMIPVADILKVTGYVRGGCSPIGMKKAYRTVVDQSVNDQERIIFSAGKIGLQLDMSTADFLSLVGAEVHPVTKE